MKTDITVRKETEAFFIESCNELSIHYEVVKELEYGSVFRVKCDPYDLYYLGRMVGLKIGNKIAMGNL